MKYLLVSSFTVTLMSLKFMCNEVSLADTNLKEEVEALCDEIMYSSTNLNLRSGPGTEYNKIGLLRFNDEVKILNRFPNGWVKVLFNGKEYYCSEKYLMAEKHISLLEQFNQEESMMYFDGNISKDRKEKAISLYNKIPQNVLNAVKEDGYTIWVTSNPYYTDGHCGTYYIYGYDWGDKTNKICIYAKSVWAVDIAVIHETGHWMDNYLGRKEGWGATSHYGYLGVSSDPVWKEIYKSEVGASGYPSWANYCSEEYFAESVWKALANPSWCQKTLPRTYEYIMDCINRVN